MLAVESPDFLRLDTPQPPPNVEVVQTAPVPEAPLTTPNSLVIPEEKVVPAVVQLPVQPQVVASATIIPPPEDASVPAPTAAFEQTIPAATPIPAPEVSDVPEPATTRPSKKRPINRIPVEGGVPQWPDFASVRQRQQLQRQQNRKKPTGSSGNTFEPDTLVQSEQPQEPSFGQKIRKVKTNALVSPPLPVAPAVEQPQAQSFLVEPPPVEQTQPQSFEIDPPVVERDETFQTLESQNAASGNQRGRIRFNRPSDGSANAIPAEATSAPLVRQTISTQVGGRGRVRITTTASPATSAPTTPAPTAAPTAAPTTAPTFEVTEEPAPEEPAVRGDSLVIVEEEAPVVEEDVPVVEEDVPVVEEDVPLGEEEEDQVVAVPDEKSVEPAEKPWSPYEAIQRQRESTSEPETASQVLSNSGQPIRIRGKTTFSSSRIPLPPARPEVGNRQIVLRPAASIRRPSNPGVRITKPIFAIQEEQRIRLQDDLIPPPAPEFGIRGGVEPKPIFVNTPPAQFLLPVGRRVPEVRPGLQTIPIRIGRPTTEAPSTTTAAIVEEDLADVFQPETNEFVTDDPTLVGDQEFEEEEEEEILTDETEGEENEEFEEVVDEIVPTTAPSAGSLPTTTESFLEIVEEQEGGEAEQGFVEATTRAPVEQSITTVETPTVIEPQPAEEETVVELAAGNSVDDQSKQNGDERDERQVLGISTATEVSLMYELCYRGRCVRVHE